MSPITFILLQLKAGKDTDFLSTLKTLPQRPAWLGRCHHWIHQPKLSSEALTGTGAEVLSWDYLLALESIDVNEVLEALQNAVDRTWSIISDPTEELLAAIAAQGEHAPTEVPPLPKGWSSDDHSGIDASVEPPDLEASLALSSYPLGSDTTRSQPITLKDFIRTWGSENTGPIAMFNLLSYFPDQRGQYFKYVEAFNKSVGSKYGGKPLFVGFNVTDWTSREEEQKAGQVGGWEDSALIGYPSIWHFGKMLDDEAYADVDRKYKQGVIRDNPLICCTEIKLD